MSSQPSSNDQPCASDALRGLRVLIVEDWLMVAMELVRMVGKAGCEAVGPARDLPEAMRMAREEHIDGAMLDINLHGHEVFPVAEILRGRGIPFLFVTGYETLPAQFASEPCLEKPFNQDQLFDMMIKAFVASRRRAPAV